MPGDVAPLNGFLHGLALCWLRLIKILIEQPRTRRSNVAIAAPGTKLGCALDRGWVVLIEILLHHLRLRQREAGVEVTLEDD